MRTATKLLTLLNLIAGVVCSFLVFAHAGHSEERIYAMYLICGILVPAVASFGVTIVGILLERRWNWRVIGYNVFAYTSVYLLIGLGGLYEVLTKKNYVHLTWLAFAFGTAVTSFVACLLGWLVTGKRVAQPAAEPDAEDGAG